VLNPCDFRIGFSEPVQEALPQLVQRARQVLQGWMGEPL